MMNTTPTNDMSFPFWPPARTLNAGGRLIDLSRPVVMGILNATPDSFYAASRAQGERAIAARADEIVAQGGGIIDVGAFSTRPGAAEVDEAEEMERLRCALRVVRNCQPDAVVSVDTFRPDVARMAVEEFGAAIINDVSEGGVGTVAGTAPLEEGEGVPPMFAMVARLGVAYVLMSVRATVGEMLTVFARKVAQLHSLGVADVILDPGFGFGKSMEQNYQVMAQLPKLSVTGLPLLVGVSRKSMLTRLLGCTAEEALNATSALHAVALLHGASLLRVHDVSQAVEVCRVVEQLRGSSAAPIE